MTKTMNLLTLAGYLNEDEDRAWGLTEQVRWPDGPVCHHCGSREAQYLPPRGNGGKTRTGRVTPRRALKCQAKGCRKQFSVTVGTIFEGSKIPLSKWLLAIYRMGAGKNGVSVHELGRDLGNSYKPAWFMGRRVRYTMQQSNVASRLAGIVEADESYIGGYARGKRGRPGPDNNKTPVLTLVQRGGEVRSQVLQRVTGKSVGRALDEHVDPRAARLRPPSRASVSI